MSNRRRLKKSRATVTAPERPKGQPWNKGLALTTRPTLGSVRRWLGSCADEGWVKRGVPQRTGRQGRPSSMWALTREGLEKAREPGPVTPIRLIASAMQAAVTPGLPPAIRMERDRREMNALKRRRAQLKQRRADAARKLEHARRAVDVARKRLDELDALAELLMDASTALDRAGYDPSALLPEELEALTEHGCVVRSGDRLYFTEEWVRMYVEARGCGEPQRVETATASG